MKVCICGGGNIAHAYIGDLSKKEQVSSINILTRQPENWDTKIEIYYNGEFSHCAVPDCITSDFEILKDMDIIIITVPSNVREEYLKKIKDFIPQKALLIATPATGGINYLFDTFLPNNHYACMQRTPYISRIIEHGYSVNMDVKKYVEIYFSQNATKKDIDKIHAILDIDIRILHSHWNILLSNSNPILHLASLCTLLNGEYPYNEMQMLYGNGWNDKTSEFALAMDEELGKVMQSLNEKEYRPLTVHYEVNNAIELSNKLKSIPSFKILKCPLIEDNGKFYIDKNSRYIHEDLPFGTCFIKYLATILGIETPNVDYAITKVQSLMNEEFITSNGVFNIDTWKKVTHFDFDKVIRNELGL